MVRPASLWNKYAGPALVEQNIEKAVVINIACRARATRRGEGVSHLRRDQ
jgi:hypothetical protein